MLISNMAMSQAFFAARLGQQFAVQEVAGLALDLCEVEPLAASLPGHAAFSLLFHGPRPILPQATYTLSTGDSGPLPIFLVPLSCTGELVQYQAVFN